jgi:hypothetical protein
VNNPSDVTNLLRMYDEGELALGGLRSELMQLMADLPPDVILANLPEPTKADFFSWARNSFDNNVPTDRFMFRGVPDIKKAEQAIENFRVWLNKSAAQRGGGTTAGTDV